ncbi:hypothetical protein N2152v2_002320 [Parachlorella kessleri]
MAAASAFRALVDSKQSKADCQVHKDKLEQTKLRERELKEAHKAEQQAAKEKKEQERLKEAALLREERLTHDSKRAAKDRREAAKKEEYKETGQMCEHGVWRCKLCFPHKPTKPKE